MDQSKKQSKTLVEKYEAAKALENKGLEKQKKLADELDELSKKMNPNPSQVSAAPEIHQEVPVEQVQVTVDTVPMEQLPEQVPAAITPRQVRQQQQVEQRILNNQAQQQEHPFYQGMRNAHTVQLPLNPKFRK